MTTTAGEVGLCPEATLPERTKKLPSPLKLSKTWDLVAAPLAHETENEDNRSHPLVKGTNTRRPLRQLIIGPEQGFQ